MTIIYRIIPIMKPFHKSLKVKKNSKELKFEREISLRILPSE